MNAVPLLAWSPFDPMHLLVIGIVALLLFGKRLPEVGRSLGRGIAEFKKGLRDVHDELNREEPPEEPSRRRLPPRESDADPGRRLSESGAEPRAGNAPVSPPEAGAPPRVSDETDTGH